MRLKIALLPCLEWWLKKKLTSWCQRSDVIYPIYPHVHLFLHHCSPLQQIQLPLYWTGNSEQKYKKENHLRTVTYSVCYFLLFFDFLHIIDSNAIDTVSLFRFPLRSQVYMISLVFYLCLLNSLWTFYFYFLISSFRWRTALNLPLLCLLSVLLVNYVRSVRPFVSS